MEIMAGQRLSTREALTLLTEGSLPQMGHMAFQKRLEVHPNSWVTYVVDRSVNYTNVCQCACDFCAFYRTPSDPDSYSLKADSLVRKVEELVSLGGTQLLLQGGINPQLGLNYAKGLLAAVRQRFPQVTLHAFSPPEVRHFALKGGLTWEEALRGLRHAGLDSLPGGGAEILIDSVRRRLGCNKCSSSEWLEIMECAHEMGIPTTATMMFGHVETLRDRIEHLLKIRDLQDRTGGFTAFIPWTYQPGRTRLGGRSAGGADYLRTLAVSRLFLDNIRNIQASWLTQGLEIGEIALFFGANDLGGTLLEENVVRATGLEISSCEMELRRVIERAGFRPQKRDTQYRPLRT